LSEIFTKSKYFEIYGWRTEKSRVEDIAELPWKRFKIFSEGEEYKWDFFGGILKYFKELQYLYPGKGCKGEGFHCEPTTRSFETGEEA
jgi:hypothetical protein